MFSRKFFTLLSLAIFLQCGNPSDEDSQKNPTSSLELLEEKRVPLGVPPWDGINIFFRFFSDLEAKLEELKIGPTGEARTEGGKKLGIEMIKKIEKEGEHRVDISLKKNLIDPGWGSF